MLMRMICAIPEEIGWALVGALGAYCSLWAHTLGGLFVEMWRERHPKKCKG